MATNTVILDDAAMKALRAARRRGESYSRTVERHLAKPAVTAGELLAALETLPALAPLDEAAAKAWRSGRGRRSRRA